MLPFAAQWLFVRALRLWTGLTDQPTELDSPQGPLRNRELPKPQIYDRILTAFGPPLSPLPDGEQC